MLRSTKTVESLRNFPYTVYLGTYLGITSIPRHCISVLEFHESLYEITKSGKYVYVPLFSTRVGSYGPALTSCPACPTTCMLEDLMTFFLHVFANCSRSPFPHHQYELSSGRRDFLTIIASAPNIVCSSERLSCLVMCSAHSMLACTTFSHYMTFILGVLLVILLEHIQNFDKTVNGSCGALIGVP